MHDFILPETTKLLISFSGGLTSAYMTWLILKKVKEAKERPLVVFSNTGREREETLEFVRDCDRFFDFQTVWIEAVIDPVHGVGPSYKRVDFNSASREGSPFEAVIKKYGIPNKSFPHCSRSLKKQPIRAAGKDFFSNSPYLTAIGIRADEIDRMSANADDERLIYPLAMWGITKEDVWSFWCQQKFTLRLKTYEGNCQDCWKKSDRKLATIAKERPESFDFTREMENKYAFYRPENQKNRPLPARFFRQGKTVADIFSIASRKDFAPVNESNQFFQPRLFTTLGEIEDIDLGGACAESCEAF